MLVEEPALDGEGAAAVRPLASSSPAPVRNFCYPVRNFFVCFIKIVFKCFKIFILFALCILYVLYQ